MPHGGSIEATSMSDHSSKLNGAPIRIERSDAGGLPYSYHLSHTVNKAIKGFWERRGMQEPGCDYKLAYTKHGRPKDERGEGQ